MKGLAKVIAAAVLLAGGLYAEAVRADLEPVTARAIASVSQVKRGDTFLAGAHFSVTPSWHIYWKYPGDAGLPTKVDFGVAPAEPLRWPLPERFMQPGDIVGYGYSEDLTLAAPFVADGPLVQNGKVTLPMKVQWLSCRDVCIREKREFVLEIPLADRTVLHEEQRFAKAAAALPRTVEGEDLKQIEQSGALPDPGKDSLVQVELHFKEPVTAVDWLPALPRGVTAKSVQISGAGTEWHVEVPLHAMAGSQPVQSIPGVLIYKKGDERRGIELEIKSIRSAE